ncbi:MAG: hypothetical protein ACYC9K_11200 [Sulfuricaulis sp.]
MRALVLASLVVLYISASPASASSTTCAKPAGAVATFHTVFANGTMSLGNTKATGLSAKACGAVTGKTGAMVLTVQPGNIMFPTVPVKLLFIELPCTITVNAPLSGPFKPGPGFTSAKVNLTANLSASVKVLGYSCVIGPLTPTLTTGKSGSLQGATFTGSRKKGFTGKVVANNFAVPVIRTSETCPWLIAKLANILVGLPAAPGEASINMEGSITTP